MCCPFMRMTICRDNHVLVLLFKDDRVAPYLTDDMDDEGIRRVARVDAGWLSVCLFLQTPRQNKVNR